MPVETSPEENTRIIFGLKLKKLRNDRGITLQELSEKSGVSVSYMNEIENGKKYPKPDKIEDMAKALGTTAESLSSLKINRNMTPVVQVLNLKIINDFLFETFGVDKSLLMGMLASAPIKLSALINSVFEIARNYNLQEEHFYFSCLRSYQEMNDNYFEDIEVAVEEFRKTAKLTQPEALNSRQYTQLLQKHFNYKVEETDFIEYPKLRHFRSVFVRGEQPTLLYNQKLTEQQKVFLFGRELGFAALKIDDKRPLTTSWLKVDSFDHVLNSFRANYFAQALHINKALLKEDVQRFFSQKKFSVLMLQQMLDRYNASPEMLLQRMSNILPQEFGINELFFIRYSSKEPAKHLKEISKDLHLSRNQVDLEYILSEQNYRRWITKSMVKYLDEIQHTQKIQRTLIDGVISKRENDHYLTISLLRPMPELNNNNNSVSIGFVLTDAVKKQINFLSDPALRIGKLGDLDDLRFEAPLALRKIRDEEIRQAEYEKLVKEMGE